MSNHPNLNRRLPYFILRAVSAEVAYFTALETCSIVVTLLAFFLRESVMVLFLGMSVLSLLLYLAGHDGIAILVVSAALFPCVGHR